MTCCRLLVIDHCHLVIINTFPINIESQVNNHPPKNVSLKIIVWERD
jgi:hypothetical protein